MRQEENRDWPGLRKEVSVSHAPDVKQGPSLDPWVGQPWSSPALPRAGSVGGGEGLKGVVTREVDRRVSTGDWQSLAVRVVRAHAFRFCPGAAILLSG